MLRLALFILLSIILVFGSSCNQRNNAEPTFTLISFFLGSQSVNLDQAMVELQAIPLDQSFELVFSQSVTLENVQAGIEINGPTGQVAVDFSFFNDNKNVKISPITLFQPNSTYTIRLDDDFKSESGAVYQGVEAIQFSTIQRDLTIESWEISGQFYNEFSYLQEVPLQPTIQIQFSAPVNPEQLEQLVKINNENFTDISFFYENNRQTVIIEFTQPLASLSRFHFELENGNYGANGEAGQGIEQEFYTQVSKEAIFPVISDEELLTKIQEQTFKYFWDFGHPESGLSRERNTSGNLVTIGGSGFGIMSMIVAVERGFITRSQAIERWLIILNFLSKTDRFHGAFPHWVNGTSGAVIPFSAKDDGGDLVETAFMIQGLLTLRQYLDEKVAEEKILINQITELWETVEWTWYSKGGEKQLYWHWSPDHEFAINLPIRGHNETQIVYILAAASPTYPIDLETYQNGYARNGGMQNGNSFYGVELPLGSNYGGPLFFTHYSYLGLDPRDLQDEYANYWEQNIAHSTINRAYCIENPKNFVGYSGDCWGLTASDNHRGYSAHSPNNDLGVITPTAAIASLPYTPEESMAAIRHFYYYLGDRLWGEYGFYDAFNPTEAWVASSYLAIDQGPIICMIENYRSQLLWDLFMSSPEVQRGLKKLGFEQ